MGDTQTVWLNVTNAILGILVAVSLLTVGIAIVRELVARGRERRKMAALQRLRSDLARDLKRLSESADWAVLEQAERNR